MLPRVNLADMTAEELAEEMVRRVPGHCHEYRNIRRGDPGRTLIDLFAWMGEALLYRANLTPRRMRLEFLNLLNLKQKPAQAARGLIQLSHKSAQAARPVLAPATTRVNGPVPFELTSGATVQPVMGHVYIKRRLSEDESEELSAVLASLSEIYGAPMVEPYETERVFGPGEKALPEGRELFADSQDNAAWIALLALDESPGAMDAARAALDAQPALLNIGVVPRMARDDALALPPAPVDGLDWRITAPPRGAADPGVSYRLLPREDDRTEGLSREGTLRLVLPSSEQVFAPSNDLDDEVHAGVGDRPPRLDDPALAARLLGWIQLRPGDPAASLRLSWLGINAVSVDQRETHAGISLGVATGVAGMRMALPGRNADPDTLALSVFEETRGFVRWEQVMDLGACGREDRCYELNAEAGEVMFGDNLTGMGLPRGARVRLDMQRSGGGTGGNLAAGTLTSVNLPGIEAHQPAPMTGGAEAETLAAAEKRVGAWLHHRNRAVTEDDYRAIGTELGLARIEVIPGFRPHQRRMGELGVVAVMAVPDKPVMRPANPRADRILLEQVHAHYEPRRPLGTELYIVSPEYVQLGATTAISLRDGAMREEVVNAVIDRLHAYLWPLAPGGQEGRGWTLGRGVSARELEVEIARVPGVRTVQGLNLFAPGEAGYALLPLNGPFGGQVAELEAWQLPELLDVVVAVNASEAPGTLEPGGPGGGFGTGAGVGVPVVPEVC